MIDIIYMCTLFIILIFELIILLLDAFKSYEFSCVENHRLEFTFIGLRAGIIFVVPCMFSKLTKIVLGGS